MGAGRRPILPAPTDSSAVESAEELDDEYTDTGLGTDLATDLTARTYSTSKTIPADGTPITIPTGQSSKRSRFGKLSKARNKSHTSLLIEYFDDGADGSRQPSVRVKIPESARRSSKGEERIVITDTNGPRKISPNISLTSDDPARITNPGNLSSLASLEGHERTGPGPVEFEVPDKEGSEISELSEARYLEPTSDISSMPADSLLDGQTPKVAAVNPQVRSISREDIMEEEALQVPRKPYAQVPTNRSTERLTQKVIEKIQNKPRTTTSGTRRRHVEKTSSRSRSVSKELFEGESRRRSGKGREDASLGTESSLASNSLLSANPKSLDAGSVRSGTSQGSSITNPRLLHTVEDAIRRLILPELNQMKNEQRKISGSKRYDKHYDPSDLSESSISREDVSRRVSKRSTSDNPKIIRSGSREAGEVLSSGKRRHRRHKDGDLDSPSDRSYRRRESVDSVSVDDSPAKSSKHRHRDLAAAALVGGALTAAALKHHESDSRSDLDRRARRKKHRSKSRSSKSRSASIAESDDVFHKHEVPPMPMRSDVGSELTRSSLLSEKTADTMTPPQQSMREVTRGSPREVSSPTSSTPKQTPGDQKRGLSGLGMHHSNFSDRNLSGPVEEHNRESYSEEGTPSKWGTAAAGAAGVGIGALAAEHFLEDPERAKAYEANLHHQHPIRRGLSPIQSVASYQTTEPNRNSAMHSRSIDSMNSPNKQQQLLREEPSYNSISSVNSVDIAKRGLRPLGIHMENPSEVLAPHNDKFETARDFSNQDHNDTHESSRDVDDQGYDDDDFYDDQHDQNDRYRDSYASSDPKVDARRMTNYTDDSMDAPYLDKVTAGQQVAHGYGANPEYVHTPPGVESAVASLYDPSLVDVRSNRSPAHSYSQSRDGQIVESPTGITRELQDRPMGSPLKQTYGLASPEPLQIRNRGFVNSPVQSIAESFEQRERDAKRSSQSPVKSPAIQATKAQEQHDATSPESEITTNPSVIQGPIGGYAKESRDHWPYGATPPTNKYTIQSRDIAPIAAAGIGALLGAGGAQIHHSDRPRGQHIGNTAIPPSPGVEDEGYITGVNPKSPEMYADKRRGLDDITPANEQMEMPLPGDDPFTAKKGQYLSGFSQGMGSPLYDSSTGQGMDRIQSQDIVALMDHLTVRDAQRNARDTEILVTLVRSAAEMRNNFEDMKKFITDTGDEIMDTGDKQHENTQKLIGGPRPQPQSNRSLDRTPQSQSYRSDEPSQRKNVFKRALQGLGSKNKAELQNIESMLMQLLDEVEGLRSSQQGAPPVSNMMQGSRSINSQENIRPATDPGYEPEGQAGTSSTGVGNSGFFSNNSSRQDHYRGAAGGLRESGNRVSTVMEGDEYEDEAGRDGQRTPNQQYPNGAPYGSPSQEIEKPRDLSRGQSEPLRTPPRMQQQEPQVHFSNENTPNLSNSGGRAKHKSASSSFFPRISRWSKTTASSITDNFRSSGQQAKPRPFSEVSRSSEQVDDYDYDPQGDDRLRSNTSFANDNQYPDENRPPSPLMPSQVSEKPKYQAVRNSINLEHPQPRQGPTGRYQHHLENEAQTFAGADLSPTSQTSSQWNQTGHGAMNSISNQGYTQNQGCSQNRELSPVSVGNYSDTSSAMRELGGQQSQGRPRSHRSANSRDGPTPPPKVRDDEPLVPQRPPKVAMTPPNNRPITYAEQVAAARSGSPAYTKVSFALSFSMPRKHTNIPFSLQSPPCAPAPRHQVLASRLAHGP
jgi:hypothetical protein